MGQSLNYFASISSVKRDAQIFLKLESSYGSYLERLSSQNRLALRAVLCRYIYVRSIIEEYLIVDAIADTLAEFTENSYAALLELQGLSELGIELLIEFATIQQINGNSLD